MCLAPAMRTPPQPRAPPLNSKTHHPPSLPSSLPLVLHTQQTPQQLHSTPKATMSSSSTTPLVTGKKVLVAGGGGFIGSHLARRLKKDGNYVVVADWKRNEFMTEPEFCDEFIKVDLRDLGNCIKATKGCHHVYNLAADMGGMGFIESNQSVLMWNNTMVSSNVLEAARRNGAERYFYSSTACVYNEDLQLDPSNPGLKEADAWPAKPQEVYGLEKLYHEEMALAYSRDFPMVTRIAR